MCFWLILSGYQANQDRVGAHDHHLNCNCIRGIGPLSCTHAGSRPSKLCGQVRGCHAKSLRSAGGAAGVNWGHTGTQQPWPDDQLTKRSAAIIIVKSANLLLRFLLELGALGYWGFHAADGFIAKLGLGLGAPLIAAVVWGLFVSPKAAVPLSTPLWLLVQAGVFGAAIAGLIAAGRPSLAWTLGLAVVINGVLMYVWGQ